MKEVLSTITGRSTEVELIGGAEFLLDPVSIDEYCAYIVIPDAKSKAAADQVVWFRAQAEWLAPLLRVRVIPPSIDPALVTPEWVMKHFRTNALGRVTNRLLNGPPEAGEGEKKP